MGFKYSSQRWNRQPEYLCTMDFTHPLSWGYDFPKACFYVFSPGLSSIPYGTAGTLTGGTVLDVSGNNNTLVNSSSSGGALIATNALGYGLNCTSASSPTLSTGITIDASNSTQGTIYWGQQPSTAFNAGIDVGMWGITLAGAANPSLTAQLFTDNRLYIGWYYQAEARCIVDNQSTYWAPGQINHWAFTWFSGQLSNLFVNGVTISNSANTSVPGNISNPMYVGQHITAAGASNYFGGQMLYFGWTSVRHTDDMIKSMSENPYQMLKRSRHVWKQSPAVAAHTWATTMGLTVANTATVDKLAKANIATNLGLTP